ncbi:hypothetical protein ACFSKW_26340 [Nonomuraea mangrovi]|uniref:Uncharacterized protein n=2 Tax=Nonomuraea TaxID=83681 RepID=A0ABW4SZC8_9ACTN
MRISISPWPGRQAMLDYASPVALFASGAEAAEHGLAEAEHPSTQAAETIAEITRVRGDLHSADVARERREGVGEIRRDRDLQGISVRVWLSWAG